MASKKLIFRVKEGVKTESLIPTLPLSVNISIKPLYDVSDEVDSYLKSDLNTKSISEDKMEFFNNEIYPSKSEDEKKLYRTYEIKTSSDEDAKSIYNTLIEDPNVEYVQFDELNELYFTPNDPRLNDLWGIDKIKCKNAWDVSQGDSVIVAVIDTGVDYNHLDIVNNMWKNSNGKHGKDLSDNDDDPIDYHGHGTHVAGTIAATINNNLGIVGVAPKAKIMAVKIFPNALDSVCANAIKYAVDNGAKILNNSWGPRNRNPRNPAVEDAINYAYSKGVIVIFASGNSNDDVQFYSPANYSKVISVSATDENDNRAGFSNYGTLVSVSAPGVNILSLKAGSNQYVSMNGTSMASPHVAGLAALILSLNPGLSIEDVRLLIQNNVDYITPDQPIGVGRINAQKSVTSLVTTAIAK